MRPTRVASFRQVKREPLGSPEAALGQNLEALDTPTAFDLLSGSLSDLCDAFNRGNFMPLMEADVAALLYHHLLLGGCPLSQIYSETRVCGISGQMRKYDIVIGNVDTRQACVKPMLIAQVKCFQRWGQSNQQRKRRFEGILFEDIESLKAGTKVLPDGCVEVVADFLQTRQTVGYLNGTWNGKKRLDVLVDKCKYNGIKILWARPGQDNRLEVEQLV